MELMAGPVREIGEFIREQRESAQLSLRALAKRTGISNPYLSQVERGLRRPSADILAQIATGLSISAESLLTKAGVLSSTRHPELPVVQAIEADPALTARQRAALIEIYTSFVSASAATEGASSETESTSTSSSSVTTADGTEPEKEKTHG